MLQSERIATINDQDLHRKNRGILERPAVIAELPHERPTAVRLAWEAELSVHRSTPANKASVCLLTGTADGTNKSQGIPACKYRRTDTIPDHRRPLRPDPDATTDQSHQPEMCHPGRRDVGAAKSTAAATAPDAAGRPVSNPPFLVPGGACRYDRFHLSVADNLFGRPLPERRVDPLRPICGSHRFRFARVCGGRRQGNDRRTHPPNGGNFDDALQDAATSEPPRHQA